MENYAIADLRIYLHRMQKSILDKMFFMDKIFEPVDSILDFGCANGELIKALHALFGEYDYVGYDISRPMIEAARQNVPEGRFYIRWEDIPIACERSLINISSTLHEVYSYCPEEEIEVFWKRVFESGFRYVAIRDMMLSEAGDGPMDPADEEKLRGCERYASQLAQYEAHWGPIRTRNAMTHFLLKYSYSHNWERELRENYVGLPLEGLMARIPGDYEITWMDHFTLPYTRWSIRRDFGIDLTLPTHIKILLKRRDDR